MKKSKFTEAQIVFALRQTEEGVKVPEICRKMGISEATFYNWKKKYGGLGVSELRRLKCSLTLYHILKIDVVCGYYKNLLWKQRLHNCAWCNEYFGQTGFFVKFRDVFILFETKSPSSATIQSWLYHTFAS